MRKLKLIGSFLGRRVVTLLLIGVFLGFSSSLIELAFAYSLQAFLLILGALRADTVQLPHWFLSADLNHVLVFLMAIGVLRGASLWAQHYIQGASFESFRYKLRGQVLSWAFHSQSTSIKDVMSLFTEYMVNACSAIVSIQALLVHFTLSLFLLAILLKKSVLLTLFSVVALSPMIFPLRMISRRIRASGEVVTSEWKKLNARVIISIKNLLLMQIYGTQFVEEEKAKKSLKIHYGDGLLFHMLTGLKIAIPQVVGTGLMCWMSYLVYKHAYVLPGVLVSYLYLFVRFLQSISQINLFSSNLASARPQLKLLYQWWHSHAFDGPGNSASPKQSREAALPSSNPGWKLSNISFTYPGSHRPVLKDFSLVLEPGTSLVVAGQSGAGKSTLMNLLLGGISPDRGKIDLLFSGGVEIPLKEAKSGLLKTVGYVGPESFLIEGTILENILYGLRDNPGEGEIREALRKAECQFVFDLPLQLNHPLTDQGQGLSAGQKQRLSLARAILRKPKVLFLDEATANLDFETEKNLIRTLLQMKGEMTIVAVSHRPAFLEIADQHIEMK